MKKLILLATVLTCFLLQTINAQITTGSITMQMKGMDMGEELGGANGEDFSKQMEGIMGDMKMTMHFKPGKQVTEINMMGFISMNQHFEDGVMTQYMDMMGQKIKMEIPVGADAFKELGLDESEISQAYKIDYNKEKTKNIAGYECYEVSIKMDLSQFGEVDEIPAEMSDITTTMYITEDIKMDVIGMQQLPGLQLDGTPLSMTTDVGVMKMTFEATEVKTKVDPSVFEVPEGDYKEMSLEELQQLGMSPGSFGF